MRKIKEAIIGALWERQVRRMQRGRNWGIKTIKVTCRED